MEDTDLLEERSSANGTPLPPARPRQIELPRRPEEIIGGCGRVEINVRMSSCQPRSVYLTWNLRVPRVASCMSSWTGCVTRSVAPARTTPSSPLSSHTCLVFPLPALQCSQRVAHHPFLTARPRYNHHHKTYGPRPRGQEQDQYHNHNHITYWLVDLARAPSDVRR